MLFWKILFFTSCFILFYNYLGYALLVYFFNLFNKKQKKETSVDPPTVSFIVAAFNEEECIEKKIINSFEQHYPTEKIEYLFITDGSTDGTNEIIKRHPQINLLFTPERKGKSAALNRVVAAAVNDILIFSDANTLLNNEATSLIAQHYQNSDTGGVAGEKKVIALEEAADEVGASEGLYWKYESRLKKLDSDFYSVVGAAGELFSVRRNLYESVAEDVILDDFIISMKVAQKGYRIVYEPNAYARELPSFSMDDEEKRKVRIAAGGFQAMSALSSLFAFWRQPKLSFLYISHRVLRWTASPVCLLLAFVANGIIALATGEPLYQALFLLQCIFYLLAIAAAIMPAQFKNWKLPKLAYYFVFMNLAVIRGFFRFITGGQPAAWEKVKRSKSN